MAKNKYVTKKKLNSKYSNKNSIYMLKNSLNQKICKFNSEYVSNILDNAITFLEDKLPEILNKVEERRLNYIIPIMDRLMLGDISCLSDDGKLVYNSLCNNTDQFEHPKGEVFEFCTNMYLEEYNQVTNYLMQFLFLDRYSIFMNDVRNSVDNYITLIPMYTSEMKSFINSLMLVLRQNTISCAEIVVSDMIDRYSDRLKQGLSDMYDHFQSKLEFNSLLSFDDSFLFEDDSFLSEIDENFNLYEEAEEYVKSAQYKYVGDYKALNKYAISKGFEMVRCKGDHGIFKHRVYGTCVVIPQSRTVGKGLSIKIQKNIDVYSKLN